jgi:hypothetical protein
VAHLGTHMKQSILRKLRMPDGKPGDNPINDMINYGKHPFPKDMELMIRKIYEIAPDKLIALGWEPFKWESKKELDSALGT